MCFACMEITRTFAPAFGKEAAMLDRMLHRRLAQGAPDGLRLRSRLSQERPKRTALPPAAFEKETSKKLRKTFGGLKQTPYLCTRFWEGHSGAPLRKKLRKKFRKNLEDMLKTPYLCNRFP